MSLYCFLGVLLCKEFCVGLDGELVLQEGSGVGYQGYDPWSRLSWKGETAETHVVVSTSLYP